MATPMDTPSGNPVVSPEIPNEASSGQQQIHPLPSDNSGLVAAQSPGQVSQPDAGVLTFIDPGGIPWAITVLVVAVAVVRLLNRILVRLSETVVKQRLLIKQAATFVAFGIYLIAAIVASSNVLNLSSQAVFALSGSLAVMAGFALKDFAASVLASVTILVTRPFQVGDRISFGDYYGEVKDIGLRSVQLVTLDDSLVTIPSSKILTDSVANANAGALDCQVVIPFYLSPTANITRGKEIVYDALLASRYLYLGKSFLVLTSTEMVQGMGFVVKLTAKAYVYDARHEKAFASDVTEMVLSQFQNEGIELPQPFSGNRDIAGYTEMERTT